VPVVVLVAALVAALGLEPALGLELDRLPPR
jgi:hypothetical protein